MADRSHWKEETVRIGAEPSDSYVRALTPSERVALVWELTKSQWTWQSGIVDEPRLRRDVERVIRRGS